MARTTFQKLNTTYLIQSRKSPGAQWENDDDSEVDTIEEAIEDFDNCQRRIREGVFPAGFEIRVVRRTTAVTTVAVNPKSELVKVRQSRMEKRMRKPSYRQ